MNNDSFNSLTKILSGISKSLGIAEQLIPLYQDTEPLIKNIKDLFSNQKNKPKEKKEEEFTFKNNPPSAPKEKAISNNNPNFFI